MKKKGLILAVILLVFSLGMVGCQNDEENNENTEAEEQQAENATPSEDEDITIDFQFEDPDDPYAGLTSEEVLNTPITEPSGDVLDNVPSNINVDRGNPQTATQGFGNPVSFPTAAPAPDPYVTPDPNASPTPAAVPTPTTKADRFTLSPASAQIFLGTV
ncbi:MAG: hypothetical protein IJ873_03155, partial [Lachnospiraceae bacterium]|nr:hypothetical protein [Lachnospiraceae bacterium]